MADPTCGDISAVPPNEECKKLLADCKFPYDGTDECKDHKEFCTGPFEGKDDCKITKAYRSSTSKDRDGALGFVGVLIIIVLAIGGVIFMINNNESTPGDSGLYIYIFNQMKLLLPKDIKIVDVINFSIIAILYVLLIIALLIIIEAAYDIKGSYELGANFEKQCSGVFMEKERADFHVFSSYTATNEYDTTDGIFSNKGGAIQERLKNAYVNYLAVIITIILVLVTFYTIVKMFYFLKSDRDPTVYTYDSWMKFAYLFAIGVALITLFSLWVEGNYNNVTKKTAVLNPYTDVVLIHDTDKYYESDEVKNIVKNHYYYITLIMVTVLLSLVGFNSDMVISENLKIPKVSNTIIICTFVLFISLLIVVPLFIQSAQGFHLNITRTYVKATKELNDLIVKYKDNGNWDSIRKELEKNITLDKKASAKPGDVLATQVDLSDSDTFKKYKDKLYMYATHILDNTHVVGIPIPQELKSIIDQKYLAGENSIELKEQFIKTYYFHKDNKKDITKESLDKKKDGDDEDLLPYLKNSVAIEIVEGKGAYAITLLNRYVLNNDNFKKGNPLPPDIVNQLEKMRADTSIKDTVDDYFSKINITSTIILILIAYYIYHNIFTSDTDIKIQYVSMISFVALLITGLIGWWMKEMWL